MRIIEQVKIQPKHKFRLYHNKGRSIRFVVTDDKTCEDLDSGLFDKFADRFYLNLLLDETDESLELELNCERDGSTVDYVTIATNIESDTSNKTRGKAFLEKFKQFIDMVPNGEGNYVEIKSVINYSKIDLKKMKFQIYIYSVNTKLPVTMFECEFKTHHLELDTLTDKLVELLTCNTIQ